MTTNRTRYALLVSLFLAQESFANDNINQGIQRMMDALNASERREAEKHQRDLENKAYQLERERLRIEQERLELERQKTQSQQNQRQAYDVSKTWGYSSLGVSANEAPTFAFISTSPIKQVVFQYASSACVGQTAPTQGGYFYINGMMINLMKSCSASNVEMTWAATELEAGVISNEFIKKNYVVLESPDRTQRLTFSARGFTKYWNSL